MLKLKMEEMEFFMRQALEEAHLAFEEGNLPIGAVVVEGGRIVARGRNRIVNGHFLRHAEIEALSRLPETFKHREQVAIFTTLEPCYLCYGAILMANIGHVFFSAPDEHLGCSQIRNAGTYDRTRIFTFEGGILVSDTFELMLRHSESHCRLVFGRQFDRMAAR